MDQPTNSETATLNIKGSSRVVSDYFEICIHNILFQRNIYPKEDFKVIRKFGLNLVFSKDIEINQYIKTIIRQLHRWIFDGKINWFTMLILSKETDEITEKWMFHIDIINDLKSKNSSNNEIGYSKAISETQHEIQAIIRQISASITFLPQFEEPQTFKILVHTVGDIKTSKDWDEAQPFKDMTEKNTESVKFNEFGTSSHNVATFVTYKTKDQ